MSISLLASCLIITLVVLTLLLHHHRHPPHHLHVLSSPSSSSASSSSSSSSSSSVHTLRGCATVTRFKELQFEEIFWSTAIRTKTSSGNRFELHAPCGVLVGSCSGRCHSRHRCQNAKDTTAVNAAHTVKTNITTSKPPEPPHPPESWETSHSRKAHPP